MAETQPLKPIAATRSTASVTGLRRPKLYALIKEGRIRRGSIGRRTLVIYAGLEELTTAPAMEAIEENGR
jgi:hypothetical protein